MSTTTTNMSLIQPAIGVTVGPTWSSELNTSLGLIDTHDHTSGKGVQITPSGLNINADLEFNANDATELRTVAFDSSAAVTSTGDTRALYHSGGDIYWRNATGTAVQITDGSSVKTGAGSISGDMSSTNAALSYSSTSKTFSHIADTTTSPNTYAKLLSSNLLLYKYGTGASVGNNAYYVTLQYMGTSAGSNTLTVPDETGTLLTTATNYSGGDLQLQVTGTGNKIDLITTGTSGVCDINLTGATGQKVTVTLGTATGQFSDDGSGIMTLTLS
mgnify:FL=1|tara:strand:+ start:29 stop:847 length:819 start_codon:yes stop_codon:yes gene_type:complete